MTFPFPLIQARVFQPLAYTYNGARDVAAATSVNIANYSLGAATFDRLVVICVAIAGNGNNRLISMSSSIGGVPILGKVDSAGTNTTNHIMWAKVPNNTTGTVSINFTGSGQQRQIRTTGYSIYNAEGLPVAGSTSGGNKGKRTSSGSNAKPAVIIASVIGDQDIPTNGWSGTAGVTQDFRYRDDTDGFASASNLRSATGNYDATCSGIRAIASIAVS